MPHQCDPIVSASDSQHSVFTDFFHPLLPLQSVLHASARTLSRVLFLLKMPNVFSKALCLVVTHLGCIQQAPGAEDALSKCLCMNKHVTGHDLAQRIFVFKEVGEGMKAICEKPAANVLGNGERLRASSPRSGTGQGCSLLPGLFVYPEGILQVLARALGKGKRLKAF